MSVETPSAMGESKATTMSSERESVDAGVYTVAEVARMFDIPESRLRYWSQTGFMVPSERRQSRRRYSFLDLIAVKVAKELLDAGQPLQRVRRSLDALNFKLPRASAPLTRLRIRSDAGRIVVDEGDATFEAATGQLLLDFDLRALQARAAEVLALPWVDVAGTGSDDADTHTEPTAFDLFEAAQALEAQWDGRRSLDPRFEEARAAYEHALELDPGFAAAWTNLGSLVARAGDLARARDCFDQALRSDPEQVEAQCNLAELALREGDCELAIAGFRQVLRQNPDWLEAHYGLARGLLGVGGRGQALAHLERFCAGVDATLPPPHGDELRERRRKAQAAVERLRRELGTGPGTR